MSNQFENEIMIPEEMREALLAEIEAHREAIAELSEEELEAIAGGLGLSSVSSILTHPSVQRVQDHWNTYGEHYKGAYNVLSSIRNTYNARRQPAVPEERPMR